MRILYIILVLLTLSACANPVYTQTNGNPIANQDKYQATLDQCRHDGLHWYFH